MTDYDRIAAVYDDYRSGTIGIPTIAKYLGLLGSDLSVLDMGCGTGKPIAMGIAPLVSRYVGVEASAGMAARFQQAVPSATCLVADLAVMDLGDETFDLCFSWGSVCHLLPARQTAALSCVVQHTKPGGLILFTGGSEAGSCAGKIGPHEVRHYSLGLSGYDRLFSSLGCAALFQGEVEQGTAYLFVYRRMCDHERPA